MDLHPAASNLFRGQADKNLPIIPKIGRSTGVYHYRSGQELDLFNAFKRAARPFVRAPLFSDWEWLALAQHHGAPTRLADWSTSPLVAAWFAVSSDSTTDAAVFALDLTRADIETLDTATGASARGGTFDGPFKLKKGVYVIETAAVSPRITTQRGIFALHGEPTVPLDVLPKDRFDIPNVVRGDFQKQLLDVGIDASHIYPDLDGVCKTLDWKLKSGVGFSSITLGGLHAWQAVSGAYRASRYRGGAGWGERRGRERDHQECA